MWQRMWFRRLTFTHLKPENVFLQNTKKPFQNKTPTKNWSQTVVQRLTSSSRRASKVDDDTCTWTTERRFIAIPFVPSPFVVAPSHSLEVLLSGEFHITMLKESNVIKKAFKGNLYSLGQLCLRAWDFTVDARETAIFFCRAKCSSLQY